MRAEKAVVSHRVYRCLSRPYDAAWDGMQFWTNDRQAALAYGLQAEGQQRQLVEADITITNALVIDSDAVARDIAERLGVRWGPPDYYSDLLDAPDARDLLGAMGYDGAVLDDGSGSRDHQTFVTFHAHQVSVITVRSVASADD